MVLRKLIRNKYKTFVKELSEDIRFEVETSAYCKNKKLGETIESINKILEKVEDMGESIENVAHVHR